MKKELKDYLHLYIGSKVWTKVWTTHWSLNNGEPRALTVSINNLFDILYKYHDSKLILRPLSSMTEDDGLKIFGSKTKYLLYRKEAKELGADLWLFTANEYTELLKAGFDCHDLITNNLAIKAETLK